MKIFSPLYEKALAWAAHRRAPWFLGGLSFAESSFFLIPPDVMLAPMVLAKPHRAVFLAALTTLASVLGGLAGYAIGVFAFDWIHPYLVQWGYEARFELAKSWFAEYGVLAVLIAGFSPVPYKVFTIAAGVMSMALLPFVLASAVGRGGRFFLVALLIKFGGERMEAAIRRHVDTLGWLLLGLIVLGIAIYKWMG